MSVHTPGPWTARAYSSVLGLPVSAQPDAEANAVIICGVRGEQKTAEANAHLIAAAPDLLAALKEAERYLEYLGGETACRFFGPGMPSEALALTRAAIHKATGKWLALGNGRSQ